MFNSVLNYPPGTKPLHLMDIIEGNKKLPPGLYNMSFDPISKEFVINKDLNERFKLPEKIYGKLPKYANHFWEAFQRTPNNLGVLLTGEKGTGKSELGQILSNIAINNGYAVIKIFDLITRDMGKIINFIEELGDVVIFFDEFGKNFSIYEQNKLLPMLSASTGGKKLIIITENHYYQISNLIRSRPGRARYHLDFKRLEAETVTEYLNDQPVSENFKLKILEIYNKIPKFTFDYLKALVEEHLTFPDMPFEEMIKMLNISEIKKDYYYIVTDVSIKNEKNELEPVLFKQLNFPKVDIFDSGGANVEIQILEETKDKNDNTYYKFVDSFNINKSDLEEIRNDVYRLEKIKPKARYEILMKQVDEDEQKEIMSTNMTKYQNENNMGPEPANFPPPMDDNEPMLSRRTRSRGLGRNFF